MSSGLSMANVNKIKQMAEKHEYNLAIDILDSQNLERSLNPQFLRSCAEIYENVGRYKEARQLYVKAHSMAPEGNKIIFSIINFYLKLGYRDLAKRYYEEFESNDVTGGQQLKDAEYIMKKASGAELNVLFDMLYPYYRDNLDEDWSFELFLLTYIMDKKEDYDILSSDYLATFKDGYYTQTVRDILAGNDSAEKYFYIYSEDEVADKNPEEEEIRSFEKDVLKADYLRHNPDLSEAVITEMVDAGSGASKLFGGIKKNKSGDANDSGIELSEAGENTETADVKVADEDVPSENSSAVEKGIKAFIKRKFGKAEKVDEKAADKNDADASKKDASETSNDEKSAESSVIETITSEATVTSEVVSDDSENKSSDAPNTDAVFGAGEPSGEPVQNVTNEGSADFDSSLVREETAEAEEEKNAESNQNSGASKADMKEIKPEREFISYDFDDGFAPESESIMDLEEEEEEVFENPFDSISAYKEFERTKNEYSNEYGSGDSVIEPEPEPEEYDEEYETEESYESESEETGNYYLPNVEPEADIDEEESFEAESDYVTEENFEAESQYEAEENFEAESEYEAEESFEAESEYETEENLETESDNEPEETFEEESDYESEESFEVESEYETEENFETEESFEAKSEYEPEESFEAESEYEPEESFEAESESEPEKSYEAEAESEEGVEAESEYDPESIYGARPEYGYGYSTEAGYQDESKPKEEKSSLETYTDFMAKYNSDYQAEYKSDLSYKINSDFELDTEFEYDEPVEKSEESIEQIESEVSSESEEKILEDERLAEEAEFIGEETSFSFDNHTDYHFETESESAEETEAESEIHTEIKAESETEEYSEPETEVVAEAVEKAESEKETAEEAISKNESAVTETDQGIEVIGEAVHEEEHEKKDMRSWLKSFFGFNENKEKTKIEIPLPAMDNKDEESEAAEETFTETTEADEGISEEASESVDVEDASAEAAESVDAEDTSAETAESVDVEDTSAEVAESVDVEDTSAEAAEKFDDTETAYAESVKEASSGQFEEKVHESVEKTSQETKASYKLVNDNPYSGMFAGYKKTSFSSGFKAEPEIEEPVFEAPESKISFNVKGSVNDIKESAEESFEEPVESQVEESFEEPVEPQVEETFEESYDIHEETEEEVGESVVYEKEDKEEKEKEKEDKDSLLPISLDSYDYGVSDRAFDFPEFKTDLFPGLSKNEEIIENNFDEVASKQKEELDARLLEEEKKMREAEELLASLGIKI
ncbi:MAG: hypothetical protein IJ065_03915 [Eubacterium sp.]|nr:hypothetical protein [Eubacterium sp.]